MHAGRHLAGLFTSLLCLLAGLWLLVGAWVLGLVPRTGAWPGAAVLTVATGAGVTLAAIIALVLYGRTLAADLAEAAEAAEAAADQLPPRRRRARKLGAAAARPLGVDAASATGPPSGTPAAERATEPSSQRVEELLLPIASALLSDVVRQRGGSLKSGGGERTPG